ncbi:MAG: universal stress protein [Dehalococcoidia bacterium]
MYKNALVTTDGSETAGAALPHVARVVDPDGNVTVVEVIDEIGRVLARTTPAGFDLAGMGALDAEIAEQIVAAQREEAERHLKAARATLEAAGLKHVRTVVLEGLPGDRIVEEAQAHKSDVVIMSTHGRSGLRRTVLGSVADHVLRNLDNVPVLLVHPAAD